MFFLEPRFFSRLLKIFIDMVKLFSHIAPHTQAGSMEMAKSVAVDGTGNRAAQIRAAVDEMHWLMAEKNAVRERTRALVRRVNKELNIAPNDFVMSVRLHSLAKARRESTLNNIREIMFALGEVVPQISKPAEPTVAPVPEIPKASKVELIFQTLLQHGAMSASQLQKLVGDVAAVSPHLTHLKAQKRVLHVGNVWSAKQ